MVESSGRLAPPAALDDGAFRRLAELSPDALIVHERGIVLWANDAAARLVGLPAAGALVGRNVIDFVAPESRPLAAARIQRMLATGRPEPLAAETFLDVDGRPIAVEVAASALGEGRLMVAVRDLRPRLQAQQARRVAEARARAFFDASAEALGISVRGVHVEVNAAYARLFGWGSPAELIGVPIFDLIDPSEHARIAENVRRRTAGDDRSNDYSMLGRRRDGSTMLLEVHASTYAEGEERATVVVMRDVTQARAAEERLAASERRYRELFHRVPVGVWEEDVSGPKRRLDAARAAGVTDFAAWFAEHPEELAACAREIRVLSVNEAACRMVGAKDEAELLANLEKVFLPETLPDLALELSQLMEGRPVATCEGWNGTLQGERRWVAVRVSAADGHEHDWRRLLVTTLDMTDRWKARTEKAALEEQLRQAEKLEAIGRLAGGVAHDFNNLLAAILGSAQVALDEAEEGTPLRENLATVEEASLRARDLVRQILTFGQKDHAVRRPLALSEVVASALGLARAAVPATVTFDVRIDPGVGTVLADRTQLHQIVLNLCTNARDAVGAHGRIELRLERTSPAEARLRVRDDGVGMDDATRAHLFEPYLTTKAGRGGHGLGLAVVHGIVGATGGRIEVESAPGKGACFDVYLPLVEAESVERVRPDTAPQGHERLLLVDDDPLVRSAFRRTLVSLGYEVTEADDGESALARLRAGPDDFALVLSDQTMPRLSGLELARAWLAERPQARILLCTGYSDVLDEAGARTIGVRALLAKPIDKAELALALRRALA